MTWSVLPTTQRVTRAAEGLCPECGEETDTADGLRVCTNAACGVTGLKLRFEDGQLVYLDPKPASPSTSLASSKAGKTKKAP